MTGIPSHENAVPAPEAPRERESVETIITYIATTVLILLLAYQVFARFVLNRSVAWSEELSRIAFVWAIYASIAYTAKWDKHIRLTFILMALPERWQKAILTFADSVWLGMNLLITYQAILYILRLFRFPFISQTLGINLVYAYFIVPIGFALQSYRILLVIIGRFKKKHIELYDSRLDL